MPDGGGRGNGGGLPILATDREALQSAFAEMARLFRKKTIFWTAYAWLAAAAGLLWLALSFAWAFYAENNSLSDRGYAGILMRFAIVMMPFSLSVISVNIHRAYAHNLLQFKRMGQIADAAGYFAQNKELANPEFWQDLLSRIISEYAKPNTGLQTFGGGERPAAPIEIVARIMRGGDGHPTQSP
jgi:hypothetical protein